MTKTDSGTVRSESVGATRVLTLSYPERRNAFSLALRAVLRRELEVALADETCRVIILTGDGGHFCSGGDISSFDGITPASGRARMQNLHHVLRLVVRGEKPVIAAVEGHAAGAGLCLAAACDIVVASREAKFSCTFNKVGLMPDFGGLWSIPARMGLGRAKLLMMSGRVLDAPEAERQGLVEQRSAPGEALKDALALAEEIARTAPLSSALVKAMLAAGPRPLEDVLVSEADGQGVLFGSADFDEGRRAFLEKRAPTFSGQ
jgi:enoyl-CoA hydratase/carnithine racemase